MSIRIKRSSGNVAPSTLASGQLAYVEGSTNGGTLYFGQIDGTVQPIAGKADHTKLAGIEAGAQVNTVTSVAGRTGAVAIATTDLADFNSATDARIGAANLDALADVNVPAPSNGQQLTWDSATSKWIAQAPSSGVTSFITLNDVPSSYAGSAGYYVKVNGTGTALEFTVDIDDGSF